MEAQSAGAGGAATRRSGFGLRVRLRGGGGWAPRATDYVPSSTGVVDGGLRLTPVMRRGGQSAPSHGLRAVVDVFSRLWRPGGSRSGRRGTRLVAKCLAWRSGAVGGLCSQYRSASDPPGRTDAGCCAPARASPYTAPAIASRATTCYQISSTTKLSTSPLRFFMSAFVGDLMAHSP